VVLSGEQTHPVNQKDYKKYSTANKGPEKTERHHKGVVKSGPVNLMKVVILGMHALRRNQSLAAAQGKIGAAKKVLAWHEIPSSSGQKLKLWNSSKITFFTATQYGKEKEGRRYAVRAVEGTGGR
jgi:hypothetical protein